MSTPFDLRPAVKGDLDFCWPIYRDSVQPLAATWDEAAQRRVVEQALAHAGTSILRAGTADKGWLQVAESRHVVELKQFFVLPAARNKGLGTAFLTWMKERADRKRKDLTVEMMANSPARGLLERLGFKPVTTAGGKITLRY